MPYIPQNAFGHLETLYTQLTSGNTTGMDGTISLVNSLKAALAEMRRRDKSKWTEVMLRVRPLPEMFHRYGERGGLVQWEVRLEWKDKRMQETREASPVPQDKAQEMLKRMEERLRAEGKVVDLPGGGWRTKTPEEMDAETGGEATSGGTLEAVERMLKGED